MCGRFNIISTPGLQVLLDGLGADLKLTAPHYNVAPTESVILLRHDAGTACSSEQARWWLTPSWAKEPSQKYAMFNARSEGLSKSPAFRKPFASQRGIVPMSSFIEWRGSAGDKLPWLISNEAEALAVAALWDLWFDKNVSDSEPLLSCTLVTTAAAEAFKPWHSRMPVMLASGDRERWLDNQAPIAVDDPIFRPQLRESLHLVPVSRSVGNSRNKSPDGLLPTGDRVVLSPDAR
ncbi:SOS response-associated peptidase [Congregibacter variabilis]|uniref:Abasic site processing protein n=1 Tax=Congregibacter variabilis TaxID=3081200 RepID=A0ABZ0I4C2_9GAMM|nr:SOS response-associated peptidase [Congregibacter sp. IMCC43200]